jgi:hypothetical protein
MTILEAPATDARTRKAIDYLAPALDEALVTGKPSSAYWVPTSLDLVELASVAVDLIRSRGVNVAVLRNYEAHGITFTPLR